MSVYGGYTQEVVQDISSQMRENQRPSIDVKNVCMRLQVSTYAWTEAESICLCALLAPEEEERKKEEEIVAK